MKKLEILKPLTSVYDLRIRSTVIGPTGQTISATNQEFGPTNPPVVDGLQFPPLKLVTGQTYHKG